MARQENNQTMRDFSIFETEYQTIHRQRMALVRIIHLWHQIGFPASMAVFAFFFNIGLSQKSKFSLFLAAFFGSLLVGFTRHYALKLDGSVVSLYRRIVTLEVMLGYRFYRDYLLTKGESARKVIQQCDEINFQTPEKGVEKSHVSY